MSISIKRCGTGVALLVMLLLAGGRVAAQTADQSVKELPQQVKTNGENKLVAKTNTVSNNAADKVDTLGTKAYKSFVNMFKKKKTTSAGTTPPAGTPPPAGGTPPPPSGTPPSGGTPPPPGGTPPPPGVDTTHKRG